MRLPHANGAHLTTRGDVELTGRATNPVRRRGSQAVGHGHDGFLGSGLDDLRSKFGHAINAAARAVDVDQDLAHCVVGQDLAQGRGELLGTGTAGSGNVIDHVAPLSDHAIQRQHGNARARIGRSHLFTGIAQHPLRLDLKHGLIRWGFARRPAGQDPGHGLQPLGHQGPRGGQKFGEQKLSVHMSFPV